MARAGKVDAYVERPGFSRVRRDGARLTPYAWGWGKRPTTGPRGGRRYQEFPRQVWYKDGQLCKVRRAKDEAGAYLTEYVPISGTIYNAHTQWAEDHGYQTDPLTVDAGRLTGVIADGEEYVAEASWLPCFGIEGA